MEQALLSTSNMSIETVAAEAMEQLTHMVTEHLLVGDFHGMIKGTLDFFTNQGQMIMFHLIENLRGWRIFLAPANGAKPVSTPLVRT